MIDSGDDSESGTTGWETELLMELHHDILNASRIVPLNHLKDVVSNRFDREIGTCGVGFTPSVESLVCFDLDETAGTVAEACHKGFNRGNLHFFNYVPPL